MMQQDNYNAIENLVRRMFDPQNNRRLVIQPYNYPLQFASLAASARDSGVIQVAANANFILTNPRFSCYTDDGSEAPDPNISIQIQDTGSQQFLFQDASRLSTVFGNLVNANDTGALPYPRVVAGRSGLQVTVINTSADVNYSYLALSFVGVQVYDL